MRSLSPCAASIPWSASLTTASGSLMSFFISSSPLAREPPVVRGAAEDAADRGTDDRHHSGPRDGRTLARNGQDRVDDARAEVAGRVDRVSGRATQRQADADDQE